MRYRWLAIHLYFILSHFLAKACYWCKLWEVSKILEVSRAAVYIVAVYDAHYFDLNYMASVQGFEATCEDNKYDITKLWLFLELRIFYCYILTVIVFILICQFKPLSLPKKPSGFPHGEFLEAHKKAQTVFSLHLFELIVTIAVIITNQGEKEDTSDYQIIISYTFLICYNLLTSLGCSELFVVKICKWPARLTFRVTVCLRIAFLAVAVGLELGLQRHASMWGCWIITSIFYFIVLEIFANQHFFDVITRRLKKQLKKTDVAPALEVVQQNGVQQLEQVKTGLDHPESIDHSVGDLLDFQTKSKRNYVAAKVRSNSSQHSKSQLSLTQQVSSDFESEAQAGVFNLVMRLNRHKHKPKKEALKVQHIQLEDDFYAMAFLGYKKTVEHEFKISRSSQSRNFYACCWIFMIECLLVIMILKTVVFDHDDFNIATASVNIYICRFICSLLLHMELIGDVKQGLNMMKYHNNHPDEFSSSYLPFLIGLMQCLGGVIAEATNIFMLATRETIEFCIMFFVAFHVLTSIDNIYAESLCDFTLREALEEPLITTHRGKKIKFWSRSLCHKLIYVVRKVLYSLYNSVYFYFTPFIVNFIPYICPGSVVDQYVVTN